MAVFLVALTTGAALAGAVAACGWSLRRHGLRSGGAFASLVLAAAVWMFGHALALAAGEPATKLLWVNVAYAGSVALPVAWLAFTLQITGRAAPLGGFRLALLSVVPMVALVLAWTSGHHLFRTAVRIETLGPFRALRSTYGPVFWIHGAYSCALLLAGAGLLARSVLPRGQSGRGRRLLVRAAGVAPLAAYGASLAGLGRWRLDLTAVTLVASGMAIAWAQEGASARPIEGRAPWGRSQQERLRQSEEQFRILFDRSPDGVLVVDAGGERILKANPASEALLGTAAGEMVGKEFPLFWAEDPASQGAPGTPRAEGLVARAAAQGASSGLVRVRRPDGSSLRVGLNGTAFPWGATTAVLVTLRDVSERMRAEEARARLESALRNVAEEWVKTFDAIPMGILLVDSDARVRRLNEAARALMGRATFAEVPGTPLDEFAQGEPWSTAASAVRTAAWEGEVFQRQILDDRTGRAWVVGASRMPRPNEAAWLIVTVRETTQLVAMQDALQRSESMASLGALVAGVAHEVRSPLFAIAATVDLLETEIEAPRVDRETIDLLRDAVERLNSLMQDLLDYGRPCVQERVRERLETVVDEAIRECQHLARTADVTVVVRASGERVASEMDRRSLVRAFQNIIQNAIQHSPPGAFVEVGIEAERGGWSVCAVRDHGGGFAQENLRRVFEPFFSRRPGGAGLGLALVRRVVEEHGGQVRARNHPEGGGVVSVRLPGLQPNASPGG